MAIHPWKAESSVTNLLNEVKQKNHPHLLEASIAISFNDSKPFDKQGKFNWGKSRKFSHSAKLWHPSDKKYDFEIVLPADAWYQVLNDYQREAWLDLHLCRFKPEYLPAMKEDEKGKFRPEKDQYGRISYTKDVKLDDEGNVIWKVERFDISVFAENVRNYGLWIEDIEEFGTALIEKEAKTTVVPNADVVFTPNIPDEENVPYEYFQKVKD
jgi:hypothetical protein